MIAIRSHQTRCCRARVGRHLDDSLHIVLVRVDQLSCSHPMLLVKSGVLYGYRSTLGMMDKHKANAKAEACPNLPAKSTSGGYYHSACFISAFLFHVVFTTAHSFVVAQGRARVKVIPTTKYKLPRCLSFPNRFPPNTQWNLLPRLTLHLHAGRQRDAQKQLFTKNFTCENVQQHSSTRLSTLVRVSWWVTPGKGEVLHVWRARKRVSQDAEECTISTCDPKLGTSLQQHRRLRR